MSCQTLSGFFLIFKLKMVKSWSSAKSDKERTFLRKMFAAKGCFQLVWGEIEYEKRYKYYFRGDHRAELFVVCFRLEREMVTEKISCGLRIFGFVGTW